MHQYRCSCVRDSDVPALWPLLQQALERSGEFVISVRRASTAIAYTGSLLLYDTVYIWVVVNIVTVPFGLPNILEHLVFI